MKELTKVERMFLENVVAINHLSFDKNFSTLKVSQQPGFFQPEPPSVQTCLIFLQYENLNLLFYGQTNAKCL
jgi:hypothetical protein